MTTSTASELRTSTLYRVGGHAGLWYYQGPAVVVTDEDTFEHPDFVLMAQAADPSNVAVVEPTLVTEFVVADTAGSAEQSPGRATPSRRTEPTQAVGLAQERQTRASLLRIEDVA